MSYSDQEKQFQQILQSAKDKIKTVLGDEVSERKGGFRSTLNDLLEQHQNEGVNLEGFQQWTTDIVGLFLKKLIEYDFSYKREKKAHKESQKFLKDLYEENQASNQDLYQEQEKQHDRVRELEKENDSLLIKLEDKEGELSQINEELLRLQSGGGQEIQDQLDALEQQIKIRELEVDQTKVLMQQLYEKLMEANASVTLKDNEISKLQSGVSFSANTGTQKVENKLVDQVPATPQVLQELEEAKVKIKNLILKKAQLNFMVLQKITLKKKLNKQIVLTEEQKNICVNLERKIERLEKETDYSQSQFKQEKEDLCIDLNYFKEENEKLKQELRSKSSGSPNNVTPNVQAVGTVVQPQVQQLQSQLREQNEYIEFLKSQQQQQSSSNRLSQELAGIDGGKVANLNLTMNNLIEYVNDKKKLLNLQKQKLLTLKQQLRENLG